MNSFMDGIRVTTLKKRMIFAAMSVLILILLLPLQNINAGGSEPGKDGNGVYQIANYQQLIWFSDKVNSGDTSINACLTDDIDFTNATTDANGSNFTAIGTMAQHFMGEFDGCGHVIKGLMIHTTADYQGLFGYVGSDGFIKNVGLEGGSISGESRIGGICGLNAGSIEKCYYTGAVSGTSTSVGGICGWNADTVEKCYSTGAVSGADENVGGICGLNNGTIENSYNAGAVSGAGYAIGSICGFNTSTVKNCYYNKNKCTLGAIRRADDSANNVKGLSTMEMTGTSAVEGMFGTNNTDWATFANDENIFYYPQLKVFVSNPAVATDFISVKVHNFGTEADPLWCEYAEIDTVDELQAMQNDLNQNYILTKDIDFTGIILKDGSNFTAIGNSNNPFKGKFDGCGHVIKGLKIITDDNYQGLFGALKSDGIIKNVGLEGGSISGNSYVGGICGFIEGGSIQSSYNANTISGTTNNIGGICGRNNATVIDCYNTGAVSGLGAYIGGICGRNINVVKYCYNVGEVSGVVSFGSICGDSGNFNNTYCFYNTDVCGIYALGSTTEVTSDRPERKVMGLTTEKMTGESAVVTMFEEDRTTWVTFKNGSDKYYYPQLTVFASSPPIEDDFVSVSDEIISFKRHNFGTENAPNWCKYIAISTAEELQAIENDLSANYILTADIDLTRVRLVDGSNFTALGNNANPFKGKFDGCGYIIKGLSINSTTDCTGLFGCIGAEGLVRNVGLEGRRIRGKGSVGGISGENNGVIRNCYNKSAISGSSMSIGGICGVNKGTIIECYNTNMISGNMNVGGICGDNSGGTIKSSYNMGVVKGIEYVGGVCGENADNSTVSNCFYNKDICSVGAIEGSDDTTHNVIGLNIMDMTGDGVVPIKTAFSTENWVYVANSVSTLYFPQLKVFRRRGNPSISLHNFGTEDNPVWNMYTEIDTVAELQAMQNNLSGNYILAADIDFSGVVLTSGSNFTAIGTSKVPFTGKFDGCGHVIKGLTINSTDDYQGLFGYINTGALIRNVGIEGGSISGNGYIGGVCGANVSGTIQNCYNASTVSGKVYSGGICGYNYGIVQNCYNTGECSNATGVDIGGISGFSKGKLINCFNIGKVSGTNRIGGVCGYNDSIWIENCFNNKSKSGAVAYNGVGSSNGSVKDLSTQEMTGENAAAGMFSTDSSAWATMANVALANNLICYYPQLAVFVPAHATAEDFVSVKLHNFGTTDTPDWCEYIEIDTAAKLQAINNNLSGNYILTADIDFKSAVLTSNGNFTAIGNETNGFTGRIDGCGYIIKGLIINSTADYQGLFGCVGTDGLVENIGLEGGSITGNNHVGGICGSNNDGTVQCCYNTSTVSGSNNIGGICGSNLSMVQCCYNMADVSGKSDNVGGVCGDNNGTLQHCYNTGAVEGKAGLGGVCGFNNGTLQHCYYNNDNCSVGAINGVDSITSKGLSTEEMTGDNPKTTMFGTSTTWTTFTDGSDMAYYPQLTVFVSDPLVAKDFFIETKELHNFGTPDNPIWCPYTEIDTAAELLEIQDNLYGNYILTADIDFTDVVRDESGSNFTAIGTSKNKFMGKFDGCGHVIKGVIINSDTDYQGLFGCVGTCGLVENVGLENGGITGSNYVAAICGQNDGTIKDCYNTIAVSGTDFVGGVCASNNGTIQNCYNTGVINGEAKKGGICGSNTGIIQSCYNTGAFSISNCLNVGAVCGFNTGTIKNCYYNKDKCVIAAIDGSDDTVNNVKGLTTEQMSGNGTTVIKTALSTDNWVYAANVNAKDIFSSASADRTATVNYPQLKVFEAKAYPCDTLLYSISYNGETSITYGS